MFDELYNFSGWDVGEYKALQDVFDEKDYKFLVFSKDGSQAAIQINKFLREKLLTWWLPKMRHIIYKRLFL